MPCIKVTASKYYLVLLSSNNDARMKTLDCRKIAYGTSKEIIDKNDKINKQKTLYNWTHSNDCSIILKKSNFGPNLTF